MSNYYRIYLASLMLIFFSKYSYGQQDQIIQKYFNNSYLENPAMAGAENGLRLNLLYKAYDKLNGTNSIKVLSADYQYQKMGFGLKFIGNEFGLIKNNNFSASYAYRLSTNAGKDFFGFGFSLGANKNELSMKDLNVDFNDELITKFNNQDHALSSDFGVIYSGSKYTLQTVVTNIQNLGKKYINTSELYFSGSYNIELNNNDFILQPKIAYHIYNNYNNIVDAGGSVKWLEQKLNFQALYHTNKSFSLGLGLDFSNFSLFGAYLSKPSNIKTSGLSNFEIGLSSFLFKRNK